MFSSRLPRDLTPNRLRRALARFEGAGIDVLDLTASNPTAVGCDLPDVPLPGLSDPQVAVYRPAPLGMTDAREAVAGYLADQQLRVGPERVVLTTSTSEAYSLLFKLLCDPGDAVLVPRPSYPLFEHLTQLDGVRPAPYPLEYRGRWDIDLSSFEKGLAGGCRAALVVNPNNPTGSYASSSELDRISRLCRQYDAALIVDEVFGPYPMRGGRRGPSILDQPAEALTFSLGGLSKAVGLPQLKLGWVIVDGPSSVVEGALSRLELICDTYLSVATPVQVAAPGILAGAEPRRCAIAGRVRTNYAALSAAVGAYPAAQLLPVEGGWYAVIRIPATQSEETVILELLERDRVLVHPGYFFDFPREAFLVVSLLPEPEPFLEGVTRVLARTSSLGRDAVTR